MIYFDNAATTTVDVEVIESFTKALKITMAMLLLNIA